jgi:2-oxoglutarate/2-oxoacid ferredoxin oxidoreductase subunit alpha
MLEKRMSVKFTGASGQGINTIGMLLAKSLNDYGYKIFAYREYPSLIKGGIASYQVDFSSNDINSSSRYCNILLAFSHDSLNEYLKDVWENGIVIYDQKDVVLTEQQEHYIKGKNITVIFLDSENSAIQAGGTKIMSNVVMLSFVWKILDLDIDTLVNIVLEHFKDKNIDLEAEEKCIKVGYDSPTFRPALQEKINTPTTNLFKQSNYVMTGNHALCLGAIASGLRAYYGYPMTPATSIFKYLGDTSKETGILVKQAENEITAVQLALGSMYMGTRALVATSGGGFDLMTETLSCAGMSETPLVIVVSQRAGASTGVPTWTGASDLNAALYSGHGEFPRCILAASNAKSSYTLVQEAFNIAETYQIPVILLTEKQISESIFSLKDIPKNLVIQRGLLKQLQKDEQRYEITDTGISPRWAPSKEKKPYLASSDEHWTDSTSEESSERVVEMTQKRMRKMETLKEQIPEPEMFGSKNADIIFVGWSSVKNTILDTMELLQEKNEQARTIAYLHYEYIFPLKTNLLEQLIQEKKKLVLVENNQTGQLGNLIRQGTGYEFKEKVIKYDGRPFFIEDILDFLKN